MTSHRSQKAVLDYNRLSFMIIFCVIMYNEYVAYFSAYLSWPSLERRKTSMNLLLVADPQIQGANDANNVFLGMIYRWDSDRYLSKTFSWAKYAYAPDAVVFLGDLMDEGSTSTDEQYQGYMKRFKGIYDVKAVKIYVAGDNDIGGEGADPVTQDKIKRFTRNFPSRANFLFQLNGDKVIQRYE